MHECNDSDLEGHLGVGAKFATRNPPNVGPQVAVLAPSSKVTIPH